MTYAQQQLIDRGQFQFTAPLLDVPLKTSVKSVKGALSSFTRDTVATVTDYLGIVHHCKAGEVRFGNCRRVENLVTSDLAQWPATGTAYVVKIHGGYRIKGLGSGATNLIQSPIADDFYLGVAVSVGRFIVVSFEARVTEENDGAYIGLEVPDTDLGAVEVPLTTRWKRFTMTRTEAAASGNKHLKLYSGSTVETTEIDVRSVQVEYFNAPELAAAFVPSASEFVSKGEGDGPNLLGDTWDVNQSTYEEVAGELVQTVTGVGVNNLRQVIPVTLGRPYHVSATVRFGSTNKIKSGRVFVDSTADLELNTTENGEENKTTISGVWVADASSVTLKLNVFSTGDGYGSYLDKAYWSDVSFREITPDIHGCNADGVQYFDTVNHSWSAQPIDSEWDTTPPTVSQRRLVPTPGALEANILDDPVNLTNWSTSLASVTDWAWRFNGEFPAWLNPSSPAGFMYSAPERNLVNGETLYASFYLTAFPEYGLSPDPQVFVAQFYSGGSYCDITGSVSRDGTHTLVAGASGGGTVSDISVEYRATYWRISCKVVPSISGAYTVRIYTLSAAAYMYLHGVFLSPVDQEMMVYTSQPDPITSQWEPRMASGQQLAEYPTDATQWASFSGATQTDQGDRAYNGIFKRVAIESAGQVTDGYQANGASTLDMSVDDLVAVESYVERGTSGQVQVIFRDVVNAVSALVEFDLDAGIKTSETSVTNSATIEHVEIKPLGWSYRVRVKFKKRDLSSTNNRIIIATNSATVGENVIALGCFVNRDDYKDHIGSKQPVNPYVPEQLNDAPLDPLLWSVFTATVTLTDTGEDVEYGGLTFHKITCAGTGGVSDRALISVPAVIGAEDRLAWEFYVMPGTSDTARIFLRDTTFNDTTAIDVDFTAGTIAITWQNPPITNHKVSAVLVDADQGIWRLRGQTAFNQASTTFSAGIGPGSTVSGETVFLLGGFATWGDYGDFVSGVRINPLQEMEYALACDVTKWGSVGGATRRLTGRSVFGWPEVAIESAGQSTDAYSTETNGQEFSVYAGETVCVEVWCKPGSSGEIRIWLFAFIATNASYVSGILGSVAIGVETVGPIHDIQEADIELDGVLLHRIRFKVTFNADYQDIGLRIGPDSAVSGEDIYLYAAVAYKSGVYLDWFRPTVPGYLYEPETTNDFAESDMSDWTPFGADVDSSASLAPDGKVGEVVWLQDDGLSGSGTVHIYQDATITTTLENIFSVYVKASLSTWMALRTYDFDADEYTYFDLTNGVKGATQDHALSGIDVLPNGWHRVWVKLTSTTDVIGRCAVMVAEADGDVTLTRDNSHSLSLWGAQLEENANSIGHPTTFMPSTGGATTRDQDQLIYKWPSGLQQYTVALECVPLVDSDVAGNQTRLWSTEELSGTGGEQRVNGAAALDVIGITDGVYFDIDRTLFQFGAPNPVVCSARMDPAGSGDVEGRIVTRFGHGKYSEVVASTVLTDHSDANLLEVGFWGALGMPACYSNLNVLKGDIDDHQLYELAKAS